jgi:hypothetical protein
MSSKFALFLAANKNDVDTVKQLIEEQPRQSGTDKDALDGTV